MTATFNLLGQSSDRDIVAYRDDDVRTAAELLADSAAIAALLSDDAREHGLLVLCEDRYRFAASILAAWQRGYAVALPPNMQRSTIRELMQQTGIRALLHDGLAERGIDVRGTLELQREGSVGDVRALLSDPGRSLDCDRVHLRIYRCAARLSEDGWSAAGRSRVAGACVRHWHRRSRPRHSTGATHLWPVNRSARAAHQRCGARHGLAAVSRRDGGTCSPVRRDRARQRPGAAARPRVALSRVVQWLAPVPVVWGAAGRRDCAGARDGWPGRLGDPGGVGDGWLRVSPPGTGVELAPDAVRERRCGWRRPSAADVAVPRPRVAATVSRR